MKNLFVILISCVCMMSCNYTPPTTEEKISTIEDGKVPCDVIVEFEYKEHSYIKFCCGRGDLTNSGYVHNPDCTNPKHKKEVIYE